MLLWLIAILIIIIACTFTSGYSDTVTCSSNDPNQGAEPGKTLYRKQEGNFLSPYVSSREASMWDPYWKQPTPTDCSGMKMSTEVGLRVDPGSIPVGSLVNCAANDLHGRNYGGPGGGGTAIYKYSGGTTLNYFTNEDRAAAAGPVITTDCIGFKRGPDIKN